MERNKNVFKMTIIAMLVAILIIQTFVPMLGYIPLGPINITIVHITVILAAILFGKKTGLIIGTIWGTLSLIRTIVQYLPTNQMFLNPLISVLPRAIVGWLSAVVFEALDKRFTGHWKYSVTAFVGTATNTVLVLGGIYLFAADLYAELFEMDVDQVFGALVAIVTTNGVIEVVASMVILPLLAIPLTKFLKGRHSGI